MSMLVCGLEVREFVVASNQRERQLLKIYQISSQTTNVLIIIMSKQLDMYDISLFNRGVNCKID